MKLLRIVKSVAAGKKWEAQFSTDTDRIKRTQFGAAGSIDYTRGATAEQARAFRARHFIDLETGDPTRPGYLSYYILWASPNMTANITAYKNRFNL